MRLSGAAIASPASARARALVAVLAVAGTLAFAEPLSAQYQPPSEKLTIQARSAATWTEKGSDVIQLEGPLTIETDRARLSARQAVIWLTALPEGQPGSQRAEMILLGDAEVQHQGAVRSGPRLAVTAEVAGNGIQITADQRDAKDLSASDLYRQAVELTPAASPDMPGYLNNLGNGLRNRYERAGKLEDLEEAVGVYRQAVKLAPADSPDMPGYLNNLGTGLSGRYERAGRPEDLEEAIGVYRRAVKLTPADSPDLRIYLNNLDARLRNRSAHMAKPADRPSSSAFHDTEEPMIE